MLSSYWIRTYILFFSRPRDERGLNHDLKTKCRQAEVGLLIPEAQRSGIIHLSEVPHTRVCGSISLTSRSRGFPLRSRPTNADADFYSFRFVFFETKWNSRSAAKGVGTNPQGRGRAKRRGPATSYEFSPFTPLHAYAGDEYPAHVHVHAPVIHAHADGCG